MYQRSYFSYNEVDTARLYTQRIGQKYWCILIGATGQTRLNHSLIIRRYWIQTLNTQYKYGEQEQTKRFGFGREWMWAWWGSSQSESWAVWTVLGSSWHQACLMEQRMMKIRGSHNATAWWITSTILSTHCSLSKGRLMLSHACSDKIGSHETIRMPLHHGIVKVALLWAVIRASNVERTTNRLSVSWSSHRILAAFRVPSSSLSEMHQYEYAMSYWCVNPLLTQLRTACLKIHLLCASGFSEWPQWGLWV